MTKMKSKKMTKSTFAIIIMAIAMVAMLAFGGTYAYFTAEDKDGLSSNTATLGIIKLDTASTKLETVAVVENVLPSEDIFEAANTLTIKDLSNRTSYIFITASVTVAKWNGTTHDAAATESDLKLTGIENAGGTVTNTALDGKFTDTEDGVIYYILTETAGATHSIAGLNVEIPASWDNTYQKANVVVTFTVKQVQAAGFAGNDELGDATAQAQAAYNAYSAENGVSKA